jgi:hypothetical protein
MPRRRIKVVQDPGGITEDDDPRLSFADDYHGRGPGWALYYIDAEDDVASDFLPGRDTPSSEVQSWARAVLEENGKPGPRGHRGLPAR